MNKIGAGHKVKFGTKWVNVGRFARNKLPSEARLAEAQIRVQVNYINKYQFTMEQRDALHMFFSPLRIPSGMTKGEVLLAIILQKEARLAFPGRNKCIGWRRKMTRGSFLKIIQEIIRTMNK